MQRRSSFPAESAQRRPTTAFASVCGSIHNISLRSIRISRPGGPVAHPHPSVHSTTASIACAPPAPRPPPMTVNIFISTHDAQFQHHGEHLMFSAPLPRNEKNPNEPEPLNRVSGGVPFKRTCRTFLLNLSTASIWSRHKELNRSRAGFCGGDRYPLREELRGHLPQGFRCPVAACSPGPSTPRSSETLSISPWQTLI
ncbi:unnamed protein product [Pleuronectes platessa]|uniref:Uncharacterized protein n=1 Tax=Pleuronectes platessa TaxID=8262 RepID=A0A9N7YYI5_PLEPL|nr:unnamed protein product [Pleuronectes platessa]